MFWKKDKYKTTSLVSKLMLLYSLSTIGIIISIALFLYPSFNNIIQHSSAPTHLTIECFKNAIIALLLGSLVAIIFGYVIADRSLKKISDFTQKMQTITADSLHERINPNHWPVEMKALGSEFNIMIDRLERSFARLSQFSSDISHELRNPLHNLMASTEMALIRDKSVNDYKELLVSHQEEYHQLSKLVENLLFLAKADNRQLPIHKEMFSSRQEILKACDYFQAIAEDKNIKMTCHGDEEIFIEQLLFRRVLINLLSNALNYTPENGVIDISITKESHFAKISIVDSGMGIDSKHIPKIFDRFYRVDSARGQLSGGLGLGLAIVKSIIELHQGNITLQSKINQGTTVHIYLPN